MLFYAYSQHSDSKKLLIISVQLKSLAFGRNIRRQVRRRQVRVCFYKYRFWPSICHADRSPVATAAAYRFVIARIPGSLPPTARCLAAVARRCIALK